MWGELDWGDDSILQWQYGNRQEVPLPGAQSPIAAAQASTQPAVQAAPAAAPYEDWRLGIARALDAFGGLFGAPPLRETALLRNQAFRQRLSDEAQTRKMELIKAQQERERLARLQLLRQRGPQPVMSREAPPMVPTVPAVGLDENGNPYPEISLNPENEFHPGQDNLPVPMGAYGQVSPEAEARIAASMGREAFPMGAPAAEFLSNKTSRVRSYRAHADELARENDLQGAEYWNKRADRLAEMSFDDFKGAMTGGPQGAEHYSMLAMMAAQRGQGELATQLRAEANRLRDAEEPMNLGDGLLYFPQSGEFQRAPSAPGEDALEFKDRQGLRKEFMGLPSVKQYQEVDSSYRALEELVKSANDGRAANTNDIAIIFNFMRALDPGSVVRTEEGKMVLGSGGVADQFRGLITNLRGKGTFTPELRRNLLSTAMIGRNAVASKAIGQQEFFTDLARRNKVDPYAIVGNPFSLVTPFTLEGEDKARADNLQKQIEEAKRKREQKRLNNLGTIDSNAF